MKKVALAAGIYPLWAKTPKVPILLGSTPLYYTAMQMHSKKPSRIYRAHLKR